MSQQVGDNTVMSKHYNNSVYSEEYIVSLKLMEQTINISKIQLI